MSTHDPGERRPDRRSSERRKADGALRESEERYRALFERSLDCVYLHDFEGRFLDANPAALDLLGYEHEDILSLSFPSLLDEVQLAKALGTLAELRETGTKMTLTEYRLRRRTGEYVDVEINSSVIFRDGQPYAVQGIARDITERGRAEAALRESEQNLQWLFKSMINAFVLFESVFDDSGTFVSYRFVFINDAYERITGVKNEEVKGKTVHAVWPETEPEWVRRYGEVAVTGVPQTFDMYHDPTRKLYHCNVYRPWDTNNRFCVVFEDITERDRAAEALREAKDMLGLAQRAAGAGVWDWNMLTGTLKWSPEFSELFGLPADAEASLDTWRTVLHPDDLEAAETRISGAVQHHAPLENEYRIVRPDGEVVWIGALGSTSYDEAGRPLRMSGICMDITERKRAEETRRESEERYRRVSAIASDIAYSCKTREDGGFSIDWMTGAADRITGYSIEEIQAQGCWRFLVVEEDLALFEENVIGLAPGAQGSCELRVRHKNGDTVWIASFADCVLEPETPGRLYGGLADITQRKQAEQALRESEEKYRTLVEKANEAIIIVQDGVFVFANRRMSDLLDVPTGDLEGRPFVDFVWPEDRELVIANHRKRIAGETFADAYDFRTIGVGGRPTWVLLSAAAIQWKGRPATLYLLTDITERKQAEGERLVLERRLQQSQKLESLGVLAGGIAHDFNNILTAVLGNAELALIELSPSAPARENLLEITQASHRAAALCRQMLAYSGRGHFVIEPIDLGAFIEDMLHLLRSTISKKALLTLHLERNLPPLEGDPSQISQIIMNLVLNASEALGEKDGVITISTGTMECSQEYLCEAYLMPNLSPGPYLTLEVSDTGCGMDAQTQERIFEPFFTTKFTGRGLGLAAVLGIVRGHKGAIKVYSEPDRGTTFKLLFPAAEAETGAPARTNAPQTDDWRGEGTILLVDDEETVRTVGTLMLERLGFQVLLAADGREALNVYCKHMDRITLVLLDLTMPHMDGGETFRELRCLNPDVRVVMSSGYTEQDVTSRFAGEGLVGFVPKPYTLDELRTRLRAALADD